VSEERIKIEEEGSPSMAAFENWESQLQARANETLTRRARELKAEIDRIQATISEIGSRLSEQDRAMADAESSSLIEEIKRWFDDRTAKAGRISNRALKRPPPTRAVRPKSRLRICESSSKPAGR
jgi:hypothetical protein